MRKGERKKERKIKVWKKQRKVSKEAFKVENAKE